MTEIATQASAPVRLPVGFEFVRMLGRGGNGFVVCARQSALDRLVAVKMIFGGALATGGTARLQREGRALALLDHPNVVRVYAAIPMADDLALVLELVEGETFQAALDSGRLDLAAIMSVLSDVAAALHHCAARGIVHRDLKPANILLDEQDRAKVADFGLARLSHAAQSFRTSTGVVSGTQHYVAPEQLTDPDRESPAGDYFSFAVIAHRALTGDLPVLPAAVGLAAGRTASQLPVSAAFARALSADPAERSAPAELMERLRQLPIDLWPSRSPAAAAAETPAAATNAATAMQPPGHEPPAPPATAAAAPAAVPGPADAERAANPRWVAVPVYAPEARKASLASSPVLVGVVCGLFIALALAVITSR